MFHKLDQSLLACAQWLVDKTQIEPSKLSGWFMQASFMLFAVRTGFLLEDGISGWEWVSIGLSPLIVIITIVMRLASLSNRGEGLITFRMFILLCVLLPFTPTVTAVVAELKYVTELAMLYIAACQKPKPPRRKTHVSRVLHHST